MERIYVTRHDYVEFGKDCDGWNCIALFLRNHTESWNGRTFLTFSLYQSARSSLKKFLKKFKGREYDMSLSKEECREIEEVFTGLRYE